MNKLLIIILLVAVVSLAAWAINSGKNDGFKTVDADEFENIISDYNNVQLLDVRTQDEFDEGHIPGAMLIDVKDSTFMEQATSQLAKTKPVAVYCRSGRRSANAASLLSKAGFEVINLDGGILAWQRQEKRVMK